MTSHWPTFADGLFWCACDNRTFPTEEAWLAHVVDSDIGFKVEQIVTSIDWNDVLYAIQTCASVSDFDAGFEQVERLRDLIQPPETADELPHRGA